MGDADSRGNNCQRKPRLCTYLMHSAMCHIGPSCGDANGRCRLPRKQLSKKTEALYIPHAFGNVPHWAILWRCQWAMPTPEETIVKENRGFVHTSCIRQCATLGHLVAMPMGDADSRGNNCQRKPRLCTYLMH